MTGRMRNARDEGWGRVVLMWISIKIPAYPPSRMLVEAPKHVREHEARINTCHKVWDKAGRLDPMSGQGTGRIC